MKTIGRSLLLAFGFMALCRISPLGAVVAVTTCVIRCLFKCGAVRYTAAMLLHDSVMGIWHWIFGPPRVRAEIVEPRRRHVKES